MKKITSTTRTLSIVLAFSLLLSSCASTTLIDSIPSGADLYLDGEYAGVTPHSMTDSKIIGSCTSVRLEKKDYHNYYGSICRNEDIDAGAIVGGLFFYPLFLWAMKYKATHFYKLQPKSGNEESVKPAKGDNGDADSLDQLWKSDDGVKDKKMSVETEPVNSGDDGIIRLDQGREITPEEFDQQKSDIPE